MRSPLSPHGAAGGNRLVLCRGPLRFNTNTVPKCLKSCTGNARLGSPIFSLIPPHTRLVGLLSSLLPCDPSYFYPREQATETKTAKIQTLSVCFSSSRFGERVGGEKGSRVQTEGRDRGTYLRLTFRVEHNYASSGFCFMTRL